jgi:3-dehydroquinate dehydratase-2
MNFIIINGPNLNLLGRRQPEIYGELSFEEYLINLKHEFPEDSIEYYQTNHEGSIIDKLHWADKRFDGIILNPGAYAHYSYAIADAISSIETDVVEVHISDIYKREEFRRNSVTAVNCIHIVVGLGLEGYKEALRCFKNFK